MIYVVIGTRAQLIKMAPVLLELESRGAPVRFLLTGQHRDTMADLIGDFAIATPPETVYAGPESSGVLRLLRWLVGCSWQLLRHRRRWFPSIDRACDVVVVHGDTLSTLLGAVVGRLLGLRVAHVESGLRSFDLLNPFPEEITRRLVFRLSDLALCPGAWAADNLADYRRLRRVDTGHNTLLDAVRYALGVHAAEAGAPYAVASVHRFENLHPASRLRAIVEVLLGVARRVRLVLVLHPVTERRLRAAGLLERLRESGVDLRPRMTYTRFLALLGGAQVVLTDGGSNQEELSYLGVPTVLLRKATERREGLGQNVTLADCDAAVVGRTLDAALAGTRGQPALPAGRPSAIVADALLGAP